MPIIKPVNYLGSKEFSNKNFRFKINFYDHNMADVLVKFKFLYRNGPWRRYYRMEYHKNPRSFTPFGDYMSFDEYIVEGLKTYKRFIGIKRHYKHDKTAYRWLLRQLRSVMGDYCFPDGRVDLERGQQAEFKLRHMSEANVQFLSKEQKTLLFDTCPELNLQEEKATIYIGTDLKDILAKANPGISKVPHASTWVRYFHGFEWDKNGFEKETAPVFFEIFPMTGLNYENLNRRILKHVEKPNDLLLPLTRKLLPDFYETISRERTLDDCKTGMLVWWDNPEEVSLRIRVQDKGYTLYSKYSDLYEMYKE